MTAPPVFLFFSFSFSAQIMGSIILSSQTLRHRPISKFSICNPKQLEHKRNYLGKHDFFQYYTIHASNIIIFFIVHNLEWCSWCFWKSLKKLVSSTTWTVTLPFIANRRMMILLQPNRVFSGGLKEITIINDINSTELIVHCKSKGADLGVIKVLT